MEKCVMITDFADFFTFSSLSSVLNRALNDEKRGHSVWCANESVYVNKRVSGPGGREESDRGMTENKRTLDYTLRETAVADIFLICIGHDRDKGFLVTHYFSFADVTCRLDLERKLWFDQILNWENLERVREERRKRERRERWKGTILPFFFVSLHRMTLSSKWKGSAISRQWEKLGQS